MNASIGKGILSQTAEKLGADRGHLWMLCVLMLIVATAVNAQDYSDFTLSTSANIVHLHQPFDLVATLPYVPGVVGSGIQLPATFEYASQDAPSGATLCSNVPVDLVQLAPVAHCVAQFDVLGSHQVDASIGTPPAMTLLSNTVLINVIDPVPFDANQVGLTGIWYNPATSGQGLQLSVFPDASGAGQGKLFGGWFTFDDVGHQRWVTLQGDLSTPHGGTFILGIYSSTDGRFGDSTPAATAPDGSATLTFYDCNNAALTYTYNDGRTGTFPYLRLGNATGCSTAMPAQAPTPLPANYNDVLHSGSWYDPSTSAQGLNLEFIPSQTTFFATWYTYVPPSSADYGISTQRWFTLQSNTYTPGDLALKAVPIYATTGGAFNMQNPVTTTQVGTADVTFISCTAMTLAYTFTTGEYAGLSGSMNEFNPIPAPGCQ